jgi:hypothetical protein
VRIARELDVHRETVGRLARVRESKPANLIAGAEELEGGGEPDQNRPNQIAGPASAAAAHQQQIEKLRWRWRSRRAAAPPRRGGGRLQPASL